MPHLSPLVKRGPRSERVHLRVRSKHLVNLIDAFGATSRESDTYRFILIESIDGDLPFSLDLLDPIFTNRVEKDSAAHKNYIHFPILMYAMLHLSLRSPKIPQNCVLPWFCGVKREEKSGHEEFVSIYPLKISNQSLRPDQFQWKFLRFPNMLIISEFM